MARVETIGDATLYLGDCLEILPTLPKVDAVITDPPYGVGYAEWDESIPDWLPAARDRADLVMFTTAPTTLWSYPRPDWLAAYSRQGATTRNALGGFCHWTPVLIYGRPKLPVDFRASNDKRAHLQAIADGRAEHPSPKPIEIMEWLCGLTEGRVLDPFMGSGTTGVACVNLGCVFVGIEREPRYFDIACERIDNAYRQQRMFA
jgi:site-specific DNA-methyltransferase (adenine-specific)